MDIEEHGRFYIQRQTISDSDGRVHHFYDVGEISETTGRYKPSKDVGFKTRDEALAWIGQQTK